MIGEKKFKVTHVDGREQEVGETWWKLMESQTYDEHAPNGAVIKKHRHGGWTKGAKVEELSIEAEQIKAEAKARATKAKAAKMGVNG